MTTFSASLTNFMPLLPQSRDNSHWHIHGSDCRNTLMYAHTTSRTFPNCDNSLGSLTVPPSAAGDFVKLILSYDSTHVCVHSELRIRDVITYFVETNTYKKQAQHDFISPTLQKGHFPQLPRYVLVDVWIVVRIPVWTNRTQSADSCSVLEFKYPTVPCVQRAILPEGESDKISFLVAR